MSSSTAPVYISPSHYASLLSVIAVDNNNNNNEKIVPQSNTDNNADTAAHNSLTSLSSPLDPFHPTFLTPLSTLNKNNNSSPSTSYVVHPFGSMAYMLTTASSWMFRTSVVYNADSNEGDSDNNNRPKSLLEEILLERQAAQDKQPTDGTNKVPSLRPCLKVDPFIASEADARSVLRDILLSKQQQQRDEEEQRRLLHNKNIHSRKRRGANNNMESDSLNKKKMLLDPTLVNSEFRFGAQNAAQELYRRRHKEGEVSRKRSRLDD